MTVDEALEVIKKRPIYRVIRFIEENEDGFIFLCKIPDGSETKVGVYPPDLVLPIPQ